MKRILIVEDEAPVLLILSKIVTEMGLVSIQASSVASGIEQVGPHIDLILLDLNLPNGHGFEILRAIAERRNDIPVIVVSAYADEQSHEAPIPILEWIRKPFQTSHLREAIERGCRFSSSLETIRRSTDRLARTEQEHKSRV